MLLLIIFVVNFKNETVNINLRKITGRETAKHTQDQYSSSKRKKKQYISSLLKLSYYFFTSKLL